MILELNKDPAKQAYQAGFIITDEDVDSIVTKYPEEWHDPLEESLPEEKNQEYTPTNQGGNAGASGNVGIGQGNGQGNNRGNVQDNDDNNGDGGSHRSDGEQTPTDEDIHNH